VIIAGVAAAGALGAVLRYLADHLVQRRAGSAFPLGVLVVNLSGSLALGVLVGAAVHHEVSGPWLSVAGTGLIGSFTTFSTFTFDTVLLSGTDRRGLAVLNVVVGLVAGIGAAAAGLALGSLI
jgi:fluoride exporter